MRKIGKKKIIVGVVATAVIAAGAGTALAYWTTSGSGTGSATTGNGNGSAISVTGDAGSAMAPGTSPQTVSVTVANTDPSQPAYVTSVSAYVTVVKAGGAPAGTCDATDYVLNSSTTADSAHPVAVSWTAQEIPAASNVSTSLTLGFNNKTTTNQDACKGAAVTVHYASN